MQAQSAKAPYVGLWSRLEGFRREQLTRAYERKRVVRATLFRVTIQLVSAADHPSFAALMHARWQRRVLELEAARRGVVGSASCGSPRKDRSHTPAANAAVPELPVRYRWRVRCLTPLVHVPPAGTWGTHRVHVTTAERWLGRSRADRARRGRAPRRAIPGRLRPCVEGRPVALLGPPSRRRERRHRGARAATRPVRGRGRPDALRPPPRKAPTGGHARAGPLPAGVGPPDPRLRRTRACAPSRASRRR